MINIFDKSYDDSPAGEQAIVADYKSGIWGPVGSNTAIMRAKEYLKLFYNISANMPHRGKGATEINRIMDIALGLKTDDEATDDDEAPTDPTDAGAQAVKDAEAARAQAVKDADKAAAEAKAAADAEAAAADTDVTDPNALAGYIRDIESQTVRGRERQFQRAMASQPFMQNINPTARAVVENRYFDPLSSQYLLAAAPTSLGGFGDWSPSSELNPGAASFRSYLGRPMTWEAQAASGQGAYGPRADATNLNQWAPWNRQQWRSRLGGLFPGADATQQPTEWDRGYLKSLSLPEAQQMISSATMAGINPIAARAGRPAMGRAFSRWEEQNPEGWGQDLLRQFVSGDEDLRKMGFMNWAPTA